MLFNIFLIILLIESYSLTLFCIYKKQKVLKSEMDALCKAENYFTYSTFDKVNDFILVFSSAFFEQKFCPTGTVVIFSEWLLDIFLVPICIFTILGFVEHFHSKKYLDEKVCDEINHRWWNDDTVLGIQKVTLTLGLIGPLEYNLLTRSIGY